MRAVVADFVPARRVPLWAWWLVAAIGAAALGLAYLAWSTDSHVAQLRDEARRLEDARRRPVPAASTPSPPPTYLASAREMLAESEAGWQSMLRAVEAASAPGVTLRTLDISVPERRLRVDVEFAEYAALLQYVEALNAGEPKPRFALSGTQASLQRGPVAGGSNSARSAVVVGTW